MVPKIDKDILTRKMLKICIYFSFAYLNSVQQKRDMSTPNKNVQMSSYCQHDILQGTGWLITNRSLQNILLTGYSPGSKITIWLNQMTIRSFLSSATFLLSSSIFDSLAPQQPPATPL